MGAKVIIGERDTAGVDDIAVGVEALEIAEELAPPVPSNVKD